MSRIVLITGSSRGIGFACAKKFLTNNDKVVIFCRHKKHILEAYKELSKNFPEENILPLVGNVCKEEDVKNIIKKTVEKWGYINILINNAGIAIYKDIKSTTLKEWKDVMNINVGGYFLFVKNTLPFIKKHGIIINVSSILGLQAKKFYAAYSASKFAIIGFSQVLADELRNVKVYTVCPGGVATKLHLDIHPWEDPSRMMSPEYVADKIFDLAHGKKNSGYLLKILK